MTACWEHDNRARSLRAAAILADALSTPWESDDYPKDWLMITRALDKLNELLEVHLAKQKDGMSKENWYYKISSIPGLMARLYLRAATWSTLMDGGGGLAGGSVGGLSAATLLFQANGIGNPLVGKYFIAYLGMKNIITESDSLATEVVKLPRRGLRPLFSPKPLPPGNDSVNNHHHVKEELEADLFIPIALVLASAAMASQSGATRFPNLVGNCEYPIALEAVLHVYPVEQISAHTIPILQAIDKFTYGKARLVSKLADAMLADSKLDAQQTKTAMNSAWLVLKNDEHLESSVTCSAKFLQLCAARLGTKEILLLTKDLERKFREAGAWKYDPAVQAACEQVCSRVEQDSSLMCLVTNDSFSRLFEISASSYYDNAAFSHTSPKTDLAKRLLSLYYTCEKVDAVTIAAATEWARALHDSLHVLSFDDEKRQIQDCVRKFLHHTIVFAQTAIPTDEARFNLYVDLRARFAMNFSWVLKTLIAASETIARKTKKKELASACLAFCHTTIPSLTNPVERGLCYCRVALTAASLGRLPQCDGLFKACVQCVAESSSLMEENSTLELVRCVASTLIVAPGFPDAFYLVRGFVNALDRRTWTTNEAYMAAARLIEALTRSRLPYRVHGTDSNDVLYGDDFVAYNREAKDLAEILRLKLGVNGEQMPVFETIRRNLEIRCSNNNSSSV